jgi:hypothetical protein
MSLVGPYLYDGEQVLGSICRKSLLYEEEIAATDRRIVCARPGSFYDVPYDQLTSIGIHAIYPVKTGALAIALGSLALIALGTTAFIPMSLQVAMVSVDLKGVIGLLSFVGTLLGLLTLASVAAFYATMKRGIIMRTPAGVFAFPFWREQRNEAVELTKLARWARSR